MWKPFGKRTEEGPDGTGVLKEEQLVEARILDNCAVRKRFQHQMGLWLKRLEARYIRKEREHLGKEKVTKMSLKTPRDHSKSMLTEEGRGGH